MAPPRTARLSRGMLLIVLPIVLLIACAASAEPVVVSPQELAAAWNAPLKPEQDTERGDPLAYWQPNAALTAEFHRRAAEIGAPNVKDCGVGRKWVFNFRTDRDAADACVADALASNTPFRVQYAYFDIDTSNNRFLFTGKDGKFYLLHGSVSLDQTWTVDDPFECQVPVRDPGTFMIGCTFKEE